MNITITHGTGTGPTTLAAFDAALLAAGVESYNLIPLSSVIPPASVVRRGVFRAPDEEYGHKLYAVIAQQTAKEVGTEAWAGLGWTQAEDGRGLFVECTGTSECEVRYDMDATLSSIAASRPRRYGVMDYELAGICCRGEPVCALLIAVYKSEGWT